MVLNSIMREFGIGVTPYQSGYVMVVDLGASPNVLPVFINGGIDATQDPAVMLTLTNEDAIPLGDGPSRVGRATSVIVSTRSDFSNAHPIPFSSRMAFRLSDRLGLQSVYVRFIDELGRSSVASASIDLQLPIAPAPRLLSTRGQAPTPTASTMAIIDRTPNESSLLEGGPLPRPTIAGQALLDQTPEPAGLSILKTGETPAPILNPVLQPAEASTNGGSGTAVESLSQIATLVVILFVSSLLLAQRVHFKGP